jgi:hypothetical protein
VAANNGSHPAGRRAVAALRMVLADRFGNAVGGPSTDGLLLVMALREGTAEDDAAAGPGRPDGPGDPGGIRPLDVPFFFSNDAARVAKVPPHTPRPLAVRCWQLPHIVGGVALAAAGRGVFAVRPLLMEIQQSDSSSSGRGRSRHRFQSLNY